MLANSLEKLSHTEAGQNVLVKVLDVDVGVLASRNVMVAVFKCTRA